MGLSNRNWGVKIEFPEDRCRVHGCLRGRHQAPHDGATQHEPSMWTTHSAEAAMQLHQRNGSAHVPGEQFDSDAEESWLGNLDSADKWNFCLTSA